MANYNSLKNAGMLKPVANTDLGSPTNTYGNLYMSGNVSLNGTLLNSTNAITPRVSAIAYLGNDTATAPAGGATITITGTGFQSSAAVYISGILVASASVVNSTQMTFVAPAKTAGNYSLAVVNPDGASATFIPGIQYSGVPAWSTSAGSLGSIAGTTSVNLTVAATSDSTVTYSITSGSLPSGVNLNTSTGAITGTAPSVESDTVYNFTIRATDGENQDTDRNFSITINSVLIVEYLVVAGGGGGGISTGAAAGGGGAGGMVTGSSQLTAGTPYAFTIGGGGGVGTGAAYGSNGSNSVFNGITCIGGGGGGYYNGGAGDAGYVQGRSGGSGGGGPTNYGSGGGGGAGTAGQGNAGGSANSSAYQYGGGGGGKGAVGGAAAPCNGGVGAEWPSASGTYYAGGGGGAGNADGVTLSQGGTGGGGRGGRGMSTAAVSGTANTGGGGGGSYNLAAGSGGSGVLIVRYADTKPAASSTTGLAGGYPIVSGGYRTYKFTSSGSITF